MQTHDEVFGPSSLTSKCDPRKAASMAIVKGNHGNIASTIRAGPRADVTLSGRSEGVYSLHL